MSVIKSAAFESYVIGLPFSFSEAGTVRRLNHNDPLTWRDKVHTLFTTNDFERVWYKHYGAALQNIVFSPADIANANIREAITETFVRWLPELSLEDMSAIYDYSTGYIEFSIVYSLPSGQQDSVKITTAELTAAGETVKVISNG